MKPNCPKCKSKNTFSVAEVTINAPGEQGTYQVAKTMYECQDCGERFEGAGN